jgi:hypothetical protein
MTHKLALVEPFLSLSYLRLFQILIIFLALLTILIVALLVIISNLTDRYQIPVSFREKFLIGVLVISILAVFTTETLSLGNLISSTAIRLTWTIIILSAVVLAWHVERKKFGSIESLKEAIHLGMAKLMHRNWTHYLIIALILIQLFAILVAIFLYPVPNNGDSMRYHMVRVLRWEFQNNVSHFATHNTPQIAFPPFAEFVILHLNLIIGSDHLARIVQWLATIVCLVGVSEIAKKLGGSRRQQLISALLCISIPLVITQASTTMNDLVVASWLVTFLVFGINFMREPRNLFWASATGFSLGLAILSKATAYIFAAPFVIWIAIKLIHKEGLHLPIWKAGVLVTILVIAVNGGHFTRNIIVFGNPLGDSANTINEEISPRVLAANLIRNIQNHSLAENENFPDPLNQMVRLIKNGSLAVYEATGFDVTDPLITYHEDYDGFKKPGGNSFDEMRTGAFLQLIFIFVAIAVNITRLHERKVGAFVVSLIAAFFLFSLLLKVHSSDNRIQLPLFVLWSPVISISLFGKSVRHWVYIPILIWLFSLPWVINIEGRPLIPELAHAKMEWNNQGDQAYFIKSRKYENFKALTDLIFDHQCEEVGIFFQDHMQVVEYPLWMILLNQGFTGRIEHFMVSNGSKIYEDPNFSPCFIFTNHEIDFLANFSGIQFGNISGQEIWGYFRIDPLRGHESCEENFLGTHDCEPLIGLED